MALRLPQGEHRQLRGFRLRLDHPGRAVLRHLVDGNEDDGSGGWTFDRVDLPRVGLPLRIQLGRLHPAVRALAHPGLTLFWSFNQVCHKRTAKLTGCSFQLRCPPHSSDPSFPNWLPHNRSSCNQVGSTTNHATNCWLLNPPRVKARCWTKLVRVIVSWS